MASVRFTERSLKQLADHDAWRIKNGWEPIALEIYEVVLAQLSLQNPDEEPYFIPGKPAKLRGGPVDIRMVTVIVRSKPFLVFFRYSKGIFQIRRVFHPRAKTR